jgi:hypothetical protein
MLRRDGISGGHDEAGVGNKISNPCIKIAECAGNMGS